MKGGVKTSPSQNLNIARLRTAQIYFGYAGTRIIAGAVGVRCRIKSIVHVEQIVSRAKNSKIFLFVLGLLFLELSQAKAETVYPNGYNILADYQLSDTLHPLTDTLIISRTFTNNEGFSLTGLYFSDNLPPAATIVDYILQVGSVSLTPAFSDRQANAVVSEYDTYWWQIDDPQNPGGVHDTVGPGETISLTVRLLFDSVGTYSFPLHSTVFMGDTISFFATGETLYIRTFIPSDVEDPDDDKSLIPVRFEFSQGYPNPFNSSVSIRYSGENLSGKRVVLRIVNALGQIIHQTSVTAVADAGSFRWEAPGSLSSGVYFYQLECQSATATGKLIMIK